MEVATHSLYKRQILVVAYDGSGTGRFIFEIQNGSARDVLDSVVAMAAKADQMKKRG